MGVYTTTELYMTTDKTPNFQATQKFLDRRFEDAATLGKASSEVLQLAEFGAKSVLGLIASVRFMLSCQLVDMSSQLMKLTPVLFAFHRISRRDTVCNHSTHIFTAFS